MKSSFQIGKIMDIPIKLHITFLLIIPVFAWYFAEIFGFVNVEPTLLRYALSTSASILLFLCVLLHELGHSYVAKKHGSKIQNITLFLFGGVSSMEEIPRDPKIEFKMALAGPLTSLVIGVSLLIIYNFINLNNPYTLLIQTIGVLNIVLFVFNLIPAFPMDGGRVLRSVLAQNMSYLKATRIASGIGKMFAIFMGIFGIIAGGIWLVLIAFFIYIGASEEEKATQINITLEGIKIKDIMTKDVKTVLPDTSVEELVELMFRHKHMGYPVVEGTKIMGIVTFNDVLKVPKDERKNIKVSNIMTKKVISLEEHDDVVDAVKIMTIHNIGRIIVKNNDKMVGLLSKTDILRSIQLLE